MDWTKDPFAGIPDESAAFLGTVFETPFERHQREGIKALLSVSRPVLYDDGEPETTSQHASHTSYDPDCRACAAAEPPEYQPDEDPTDAEAWLYE